jgi:hypothetical protein
MYWVLNSSWVGTGMMMNCIKTQYDSFQSWRKVKSRAARKLEPAAQITLECYYTAAVFIRKKYQPRRKALPDHFSRKLNLSLTNSAEENLHTLAKRHREISGIQANWFGTYNHAAKRWLVHTGFGK